MARVDNKAESNNPEKDHAPNESKKVMPQTADKSKQDKPKRQREQTDSIEESNPSKKFKQTQPKPEQDKEAK